MRLGTRVLLLSLATTLGLSGVVLWIVTAQVTRRETSRAVREIREAIQRHEERLDQYHKTIHGVVRLLMLEPARRSELEKLEADREDVRELAVSQFSEEFLGRDVHYELATSHIGAGPDFQLLLNVDGDVLVVASKDGTLRQFLRDSRLELPFERILDGAPNERTYVWLGDRLYAAFGVPVVPGPDDPPTYVHFAGYLIDDTWFRRFVRPDDDEAARSPLIAGLVVDRKVVAHAATDIGAPAEVVAAALTGAAQHAGAQSQSEYAEYRSNRERYIGQVSRFRPAAGAEGAFAVVSSLDRALAGLRELQRTIGIVTLVVASIAVVVCRQIARMIARPVEQLVTATEAVTRGDYGVRVETGRRDELGQLATSFGEMAAGLRQRDLIKDTFGKFVDPSIVEGFLQDPARLELGGQRRDQTVLFCDLANFTPLAERLAPEELVELLNGYLGSAAEIITVRRGIVDKFIGDAVVAFWGPPLAEDHAARACQAANGLVGCAERIAERAAALGCGPVHVRVGIATGEVLVGNIGSPNRYNYTVIGDVVNLASRLEGLNKVYGTSVLASRPTVEQAGAGVTARWIDTVRVVGRDEAVDLFEVIDAQADGDATRQWCAAYAGAFELYRGGRWAEARAAFGQIVESWPDDRAAGVMAARCATFVERGAGAGWDGVWRVEGK